ncbi:putative angiopoietin-2-like, partial [Apostichopus japonicus]
VIQRRGSGAVNFNRSWSQYEDGFGFLSTEFWLGNEKLSHLTNQADYELRVDIELSNGASFYTTYRGFRITDAWGQYQFKHIGGTLISTCPTNMIYGPCSCPATCEDPNGQSGCNSDCLGSEGCICPAGFVMQGSDCINASECECFVAEANLVIPAVNDAGHGDGVYTIMPTGWPESPFNVHCKMHGDEGWTVFNVALMTI